MKFGKNPRLTHHAFTVLEVSVVAALIAVLLALGWSAALQLRKKADAVRCLVNLRSIGVGFRDWRAGNNDRWPNNYNLRPSRILFDLGIISDPEIMQCPAAATLAPGKGGGWDDTVPAGRTAFDRRFRGHLVSYGMYRNFWVSEAHSRYSGSYRFFLGRESRTPWLLDSRAWKTAAAGDVVGLNLVSYRHSGHANVLFLDGHVESLTEPQLRAIVAD